MSNPRSQKERSRNSPSQKPTCTMCSKKHMGECSVGTNNFFGCGKSGHKVRECPVVSSNRRGVSNLKQAILVPTLPRRTTSKLSTLGVIKRNLLCFHQYVTSLFIDVYALLDNYATLSCVTPLVDKKFDVLLDVLIEPYLVSNPGELLHCS